MKKTTVIGLIVVGVVTIGCATLYESENNTNQPKNTASVDKWKKQAPQLFNNAGYVKLEEPIPQPVNQSESMAQLMGTITNPFGIRDDILEYIINNVPNDNESAMQAAIKMMQYSHQIYFGNLSESEAVIMSNKNDLAAHCLAGYLHISNNNISGVKEALKIQQKLYDTKERRKYVLDTDRKYFSYKVLGTGLSGYETELACKRGEF